MTTLPPPLGDTDAHRKPKHLQVVPDLETQVSEAMSVGDVEVAKQAVLDWRVRARQFLQGAKRKRSSQKDPCAPRKKMRKGAASLGLALDNSLQAALGVGLSMFRVPLVEGEVSGDPFLLPRLGVSVVGVPLGPMIVRAASGADPLVQPTLLGLVIAESLCFTGPLARSTPNSVVAHVVTSACLRWPGKPACHPTLPSDVVGPSDIPDRHFEGSSLPRTKARTAWRS